MGPCICGDTACPSCGPAQGYDPILEKLYDRIGERWPRVVEAITDWTDLEEAMAYAFSEGVAQGHEDERIDNGHRQLADELEKE